MSKKQELSPASVKELESQIDAFKLQRYSLLPALTIYEFDQKNIMETLDLKIKDVKRKIAILDSNIAVLSKNLKGQEDNMTEEENKTEATPEEAKTEAESGETAKTDNPEESKAD